jgi:site-specific DNA-methyltransferase (adenine-specific)
MLDFNNLPAKEKIYYQDDAVVIYCADCREILPLFPDKYFDLVLTDPPYGIGASSKKFVNGTSVKRKDYYEDIDWDTEIPSHECFLELFRVSENQIIWGGNYFWEYLKVTRCFLIWDKTIHGNSYADCEMDKVARCEPINMVAANLDGRVHPTQKPLKLIKWSLSQSDAQTILDPFLGSGTTAVAAKILGRKCVGIEISEKYAHIAAQRCSQSVMQLEIPKEDTKQESLI